MLVLKLAPVLPLLQLYESDSPLQAVPFADTATLGEVQVIGPALVAITEGLQVSTNASQELEAVQPLDCVTVTV